MVVCISLYRGAVLRVATTSRLAKRARACKVCASSPVRLLWALFLFRGIWGLHAWFKDKPVVLYVQAGMGDKLLRIGFIGAGGINFGTKGESWPFTTILAHTYPQHRLAKRRGTMEPCRQAGEDSR